MNEYRIEIRVVPRRGLLDPQGKAVADALHALGFADVADARVGRHLVLDVRAADPDAARRRAAEMCDRLLANPVTEDYVVEEVAPAPSGDATA
jgi:phosphoribosylformylglycinamidine synthase